MNTCSTCPYCGVGCGVEIATQTDSISVNGDQSHPANYGRLCVKGSNLAGTLGEHQRLLQPKIGNQIVSWEEALSTVSSRIRECVDMHGPSSVAMYLSGQLLTEDYYVANKLMKGFIGSPHVDTNSRLCMASSVVGHKRSFGEDIVPGCYEDLEQADLLILVGSNAAWNHPILHQRMVAAKQKRRCRVVVIDPRRTATSEFADLHLAIKPGSDTLLFNVLLAQLHARGQTDKAYINTHTEGFEKALQAAQIDGGNIDDAAAKLDIPSSDLECLISWFAETQRTVTLYSQGVNQSSSGSDKVNAIINCHLATGRIGAEGMGPFSLTGQPNAMGGREVGGLANQLAVHEDFADPAGIARVADFWNAPNMVKNEGLKAVELFQAVEAGRIKIIWIMGTNPVVSMPDAAQIKSALQKAELVIVSECMQSTDTLAYADIALPATTWGEKFGTVTNSERRISRQRAFLPPPGEARHDWQIINEVARHLGFQQGFNHQGPADIFREYATLTGYKNAGRRLLDISGLATISNAAYDALKPIQWPVTKANPHGTSRLFSNGQFSTPNQRARFIPVRAQSPHLTTQGELTYRLNSGRLRDQWHTMTRTGRAAILMQHCTEPFVAIHPRDAETHQLSDLDLVHISNAQGAITVRTAIDEGQRIGELFVPIHWSHQFSGNAIVSQLFPAIVDPLSGQPESKHGVVQLQKLNIQWEARLWFSKQMQLKPSHLPVDYWSKVTLPNGTLLHLASQSAVDDWSAWLTTWLGQPSIFSGSHKHDYIRAVGMSHQHLRWAYFAAPREHLPDLTWIDSLANAPVDAEIQRCLLSGAPASGAQAGKVICSCYQVREPQILEEIAMGCNDLAKLQKTLRCGTNCGSCIPELKGYFAH